MNVIDSRILISFFSSKAGSKIIPSWVKNGRCWKLFGGFNLLQVWI